MSLAAAAAYETVSDDFMIDTLHTYFLAGPKYEQRLQLKVQRLNDGGRFATRMVTVEQAGLAVVHVTCSFVRSSAMSGNAMTHSIRRASSGTIDEITLDDLEHGRDSRGPIMKVQRLSITPHNGTTEGPGTTPPESLTYTSAATISLPITSTDHKTQALGIIALSDYHVLDAPPTLHGVPFGLPAIGDRTRSAIPTQFSVYTSLNHTIRFHLHDSFRADGQPKYIEVTSPWAAKRRAEVHSRIFSNDGRLIASCVQGSYYVMKEQKDGSKL
jgi:acyl-CoA thioesterase II